jgi:hypothetical protein
MMGRFSLFLAVLSLSIGLGYSTSQAQGTDRVPNLIRRLPEPKAEQAEKATACIFDRSWLSSDIAR